MGASADGAGRVAAMAVGTLTGGRRTEHDRPHGNCECEAWRARATCKCGPESTTQRYTQNEPRARSAECPVADRRGARPHRVPTCRVGRRPGEAEKAEKGDILLFGGKKVAEKGDILLFGHSKRKKRKGTFYFSAACRPSAVGRAGAGRPQGPSASEKKGKRKKSKGTFYFSARLSSFRGRPRGRRLASRPKRFAVAVAQRGEPSGAPRFTLRRTASNSASVSGSFTRATSFRPRSTGPGCINDGPPGRDHQRRLDHGQTSARLTSDARNGFRST